MSVRVGLIHFVGMLNLVFGGLYVALGLWILLAGGEAVVGVLQARQEVGQLAAQVPAGAQDAKTVDGVLNAASQGIAGLVLAVASIIAGCSIVQGLPLVLVGAGVMLRQRWARVFALFFAALALLEGVACLASKDSSPVVLLIGGVLLGYGVVSFVALLGRPANDFFARRDLAADGAPAKMGRPVAAAAAVMLVVVVGLVGAAWYLSRPGQTTPGAIAKDGSKAKGPVLADASLPRYQQHLAALHEAIARGQTSRVQELIKDGVGVNDRDDKGETPLMKVVASGYADLAPLLITKGAKVEARDADGNDVFLHAATRGKVEWLVRAIPFSGLPSIQLGPDFGGDWRGIVVEDLNNQKMTVAMVAAANGHLDDLQWMLRAMGTWPSRDEWLARKDKDGKTALDHAAAKGHTAVVKFLESAGVRPGAGIQVADKKDAADGALAATAARLGKAIAAADAEEVDQVLRPASDAVKRELMRLADADGKTPLIHAAAKGDVTLVMLLQQNIRNWGDYGLVAAADKQQRTALHYAAEKGHAEVLGKLLGVVDAGWHNYERGTDAKRCVHWFRLLRQRDAAGKTAGELAQDQGHKEAAELLERYAREHFLTPTWVGRTVLEQAANDGELALVRELLKVGCPPMRDAKDYAKNNTSTPLMAAAFNGHLLVVKALLASIGDKQKREEYVNFRVGDVTALSAAAASNQPEITALLRAHGAKEK